VNSLLKFGKKRLFILILKFEWFILDFPRFCPLGLLFVDRGKNQLVQVEETFDNTQCQSPTSAPLFLLKIVVSHTLDSVLLVVEFGSISILPHALI